MAIRALAKEEANLLGSYCKVTVQRYLAESAGIRVRVIIPSPCNLYIKMIKEELKRGSIEMQAAVCHLLVTLYPDINREVCPSAPSTNIAAFAKATALTHLEHNGMQVVAYAVKVCSLFHLNWSTLSIMLYSRFLASSLNSVREIFMKYHSKGKETISWWWARVVDDGYLIELASENHSTLISILAHMLYFKAPELNREILQARVICNLSPDDRIQTRIYAETMVKDKLSIKAETIDPQFNQNFETRLKNFKSLAEDDDKTSEIDARGEELLQRIMSKAGKYSGEPLDKVTQSIVAPRDVGRSKAIPLSDDLSASLVPRHVHSLTGFVGSDEEGASRRQYLILVATEVSGCVLAGCPTSPGDSMLGRRNKARNKGSKKTDFINDSSSQLTSGEEWGYGQAQPSRHYIFPHE